MNTCCNCGQRILDGDSSTFLEGKWQHDMCPDIIARDLIVSLRGMPTHCNFCGLKKPLEQLHPEEAGMWICESCLKEEP